MQSRLGTEAGTSLFHTKKKSGWGRKATAAILATTVLASAGVGAATVASAADDPAAHWHGANYVVPPANASGDWNTWLGSMHDPNSSEFAWCVEWGTDAGMTPSTPGTIADGNAALFNYIVQTKQGDTSQHSAIAEAAHRLFDPKYAAVWDGNGPAFGTLATAASTAGPRAAADQMIAEARANAGPYTVLPHLNLDASGRRGTVTNTFVRSASGSAINGWAATATLNGPAVWDGTNSKAVNLHAGDVLPQFISTGNGQVSVTINVTGAPGATVLKHKVPGEQGMVVTSGKTTVSGQSGDVRMTFDFQPKATSTAVTYVEAGDKLADVLHVNTSTGSANDWAFVDGKNVPAIFDVDWYYSPTKLAPSAEVPASAKLHTSGKATANGVGDITVTGDKTAEKAGYYYPVAKFSKTNQPEGLRQYFTADWKAGFNDPNEQTIVKYTPEVRTKTAEIADGKIHDVITVTGNNPEVKLDVVSKLIMTNADTAPAGTDKAPADAEIIATVTTPVTGNGEVKTEDVKVPWGKIIEAWDKGDNPKLYWQENIVATESTKPWTGKHLLPAETVKTEKPSIITKASENGTVPLDMNDTGIVSGTIPSGEGVKVETKVEQFKFDNSTDGSAQAVCANPFYESPWQDVTTTTVTYPTHKTEFVGTYGYVETLKVGVTENGKTTETVLHKGKCGQKEETVIAFPKDVPPTPEKPELPTPEKPVVPAKPVVPVVPAGNIVAVDNSTPNTAMLIGGGALALAGLTLASVMVVRRRKSATEELVDTK